MSDGSWNMKLLGMGLTLLLISGCTDMEPVQSTPSSPPPPASAAPAPAVSGSAAGIEFQAPEGWIQEAPSSAMRVAQYRIPRVEGDSADSDMVVFHFSGGGGSVQANMDRWVGQFSTADGRPVTDQARISEKDGNGVSITLVDVSGTYNESRGPMMAETTARPDYRMLAAVVEGAGGPWFFKLTGPRNTVDQSEQGFDALLESLQLGR